MQILWIFLLQIVGTAAIIAEIMVPSFGLLTVGALGSFGYSYYLLWLYDSSAIPVMIVINLFSIPITLFLAVKGVSRTKLTLNNTLDQKDGKVTPCCVGDVGESVTDLRPAGKVIIAEKVIDVLSTGDYIEKGQGVKVISIDNSGIQVVRLSEKITLNK